MYAGLTELAWSQTDPPVKSVFMELGPEMHWEFCLSRRIGGRKTHTKIMSDNIFFNPILSTILVLCGSSAHWF